MRSVALVCLGLGFAACGGDEQSPGAIGSGGTGSSGRAAVGGSAGSVGASAGRGAGGSATGGTGTAGSGASGGSSGSVATGGTAGMPASGGAAGGMATGGGGGRPGAGSGGDAGAVDAGASGEPNVGATGGKGGTGGGPSTGDYDAIVLADGPVAYWPLNQGSGTEPDLTANGRDGSHQGGTADLVELPNGDMASDFDGDGQFVTVPSHASFSISTTGNMTWEAWIRPDVLQYENDYVNWMGKCAGFSENCEWEARMYSTENSEDRCNRISAYVFNQSAGLGSAADWQPECGLIEAGSWYHVVGEYTTESEPSDCQNADQYPGSIEIWVNGVKWDHGSHGQTGCMSQYDVIPGAYDSPLNIGTMSEDDWFPGAIGKVAIYDKLLPETDILEHYTAMTGATAQGDCGGTCNFD